MSKVSCIRCRIWGPTTYCNLMLNRDWKLSRSPISASEKATRSSYSFAALKRTRQFCCFGKCTSYRQSSLLLLPPSYGTSTFPAPMPTIGDRMPLVTFPDLLPFPSLFPYAAFGQPLGGSNEKYLVTSQNKVDYCVEPIKFSDDSTVGFNTAKFILAAN